MDARSAMLLSSVSFVRAHADGSLLVHDLRARRVVWLNAALDSLVPVVDRTPATGFAYSSSVGGIIPWHGDSTLFVDPSSYSMVLFDAKGKAGRVMALPPVGVSCFIGGPAGMPALDPEGRIVCRMPRSTKPGARTGNDAVAAPELADTAALIGYDIIRRNVDTISFLHVGRLRMTYYLNEECVGFIVPLINPLPVVDDWTVTPDGVAIIHGADFRIERFGAPGLRNAVARIPFSPRAITEEEKSAYVDSTKQTLERLRSASPASSGPSTRSGAGACDRSRPRAIQFTLPGLADDPVRRAAASTREAQSPLLFAPTSDLPDTVPPFAPGSARTDREGNIWIRTLEAVKGGSVYDVVDRQDRLVARVLVPPGRVIAGFGQGGVVYMGVSEPGGVRLERARFRLKP